MQVDFADLQTRFPTPSGTPSTILKTDTNTAQATGTLPVWDAQVLTAMVGNSPKLHRELLNSLFENSETTVMEIRTAYEKRELKPVARAAYKLKSAAAAFGAMELAAACTALEQAANNNDWPATGPAHDHLQDAYRRFAVLHGRTSP